MCSISVEIHAHLFFLRRVFMHIPENYLSPSTCGVMTAAMIPIWVRAAKNVKKYIPKEKMPLLGVAAAFSFLGMMFNIPLPGGTTGHAVGGTLIALLLGPDAACISVTIALLVQALIFGDGGILSFGANCFNMAFVLPYLGYAVYGALEKKLGKYPAAAIASYIGINAASLCAAIEFGIQPYLFTDEAGLALYCPYGLGVSIPVMMVGHLTLFGLAEVLFTVGIYAFVSKVSPDIITKPEGGKTGGLMALIGVLILCVPAGLLAEGTAWGEWGLEELAEMGYTPSGMVNGFNMSVLIPDYAIEGIPDAAGYILSAVIGVAVLVLLFRIIASGMKKKTDYSR